MFFKQFFDPFQTPFNVNLLIAGYDNEKEACEFYVLDYLASMVTTKFAAHGYGGFFSTAILDSKYRDGEIINRINLFTFYFESDSIWFRISRV